VAAFISESGEPMLEGFAAVGRYEKTQTHWNQHISIICVRDPEGLIQKADLLYLSSSSGFVGYHRSPSIGQKLYPDGQFDSIISLSLTARKPDGFILLMGLEIAQRYLLAFPIDPDTGFAHAILKWIGMPGYIALFIQKIITTVFRRNAESYKLALN